ncbi:MAG: MFS transporter [Anaerolineales bacterium]|jgi:MFS family permease
MTKNLRWYDCFTINIYWVGLTTITSTLTPLIGPLLVQRFVGEAVKGSFLGSIRLWTLMVALLSQAFMGMLSDRSTFRWGRRRPFILLGTMVDLVFLGLIAFSAGLEGMTGYWVLFASATLLSISSNTAYSAQQALIPDLVPQHHRGRFSAVKVIFELPIPIILVAFTVGRLIAAGRLVTGIAVTCGILFLSMLIAMFVREKPSEAAPSKGDWAPFLRLVFMTVIFTGIILGVGELVKRMAVVLEAIPSAAMLLAYLGVLGLAAVVIVIGLGVWISVRIAVGEAIRERKEFFWWIVNRLTYLVPASNLAAFAVYFLQGRFGFTNEEAAVPASQLIVVVGLFLLLVALPSGWLADRYGRKRILIASSLISAVGTLVTLLSPNLTVLFIGASLIGGGTGLFYSANWALGTDLVPKDEAGRYLGIANLAGAGAGAVGAYIGGPIADSITRAVPQTPGLGYVLLFAVFAILFLLSSIALIKIPEPRRCPVETGLSRSTI